MQRKHREAPAPLDWVWSVLDADGPAVPKPLSVPRPFAVRRQPSFAERHRAADGKRAHVSGMVFGVPTRQPVQRGPLVSLRAVRHADAGRPALLHVSDAHGRPSRFGGAHILGRIHPHRLRHSQRQPGDEPRIRLPRSAACVVHRHRSAVRRHRGSARALAVPHRRGPSGAHSHAVAHGGVHLEEHRAIPTTRVVRPRYAGQSHPSSSLRPRLSKDLHSASCTVCSSTPSAALRLW